MSRSCLYTRAMEITQQVRDYAEQKELEEKDALAEGMAEKSEEFRETGGEIHS